MGEGRVVQGTSSTWLFRITGKSYPWPPPAVQRASRSHKNRNTHTLQCKNSRESCRNKANKP